MWNPLSALLTHSLSHASRRWLGAQLFEEGEGMPLGNFIAVCERQRLLIGAAQSAPNARQPAARPAEVLLWSAPGGELPLIQARSLDRPAAATPS